MDDRYLFNRLNLIDAALGCIIKRQGALAAMIMAKPEVRPTLRIVMDEALDDYIAAIDKVKKEYEDERSKENSPQEK